jgi:hypothetical protein
LQLVIRVIGRHNPFFGRHRCRHPIRRARNHRRPSREPHSAAIVHVVMWLAVQGAMVRRWAKHRIVRHLDACGPANRSLMLRSHRRRFPPADPTHMTTALSHFDGSSAPPVSRRTPHRRPGKAARYDLAWPRPCASRLTSDDRRPIAGTTSGNIDSKVRAK